MINETKADQPVVREIGDRRWKAIHWANQRKIQNQSTQSSLALLATMDCYLSSVGGVTSIQNSNGNHLSRKER